MAGRRCSRCDICHLLGVECVVHIVDHSVIGAFAVFAFCAVAVMLGALPHHHHDGSQAVCFNPTHCFAHSDNHSDCCDHDHCSSEQDATGEHSSCHLKIDVAEVISQLSKQSLLPPVQLQTLVAEPFELLALIEYEVEYLDYLAGMQRVLNEIDKKIRPNTKAVISTHAGRNPLLIALRTDFTLHQAAQ